MVAITRLQVFLISVLIRLMDWAANFYESQTILVSSEKKKSFMSDSDSFLVGGSSIFCRNFSDRQLCRDVKELETREFVHVVLFGAGLSLAWNMNKYPKSFSFFFQLRCLA